MTEAADTVFFGWALASILYAAALWSAGQGFRRWHRHAALAGGAILAGAAIYGADIMNLPEIAGAMIIGAAVGLMSSRELPLRMIPGLMNGLGTLGGGAMICAAIAMRHNPYAFSLIDEEGGSVAPWRVAALAVAMLTGGMATGAGMAGDRIGAGNRLWLAVPLSLFAGGSLALFSLAEGWPWLATGLALSLPAGALIGGAARRGGEASLLASVGALVGCSAAAIAFLLDNAGLVVAGGLAASAGGVLALRLCARTSGKGLAEGRRPA